MGFGKRDIEKEKYWQELITQQRQSGLSGHQFCKQQGVSEHRFFYWKSSLTKRQKIKNQQKSSDNKIDMPFVPLKLPSNPTTQVPNHSLNQIEISKITIKISASIDKTALTSILQSMEKV